MKGEREGERERERERESAEQSKVRCLHVSTQFPRGFKNQDSEPRLARAKDMSTLVFFSSTARLAGDRKGQWAMEEMYEESVDVPI